MDHDTHSDSRSGWVDHVPVRTAFGVGMACGVGTIGLLGFLILLPGAIRAQSGKPADTGTAAAPTAPTAPSGAAPDAAPSGPVNITVTDDDHIRGNPNAKVTIVEWSDFQCPFCSRFHPTVRQAMSEYGDKVRWVYRHFPLESIHPNARPAAEASECASEQGKFWEYADKLFEQQDALGPDLYKRIAKDLKLNEKQFNDCVTSRKYQKKVEGQEQSGLAIGVRGTPASYVNGMEVPGAVPYAQLKSLIEQALNQ
ncbi:DsbA family protein [Candidatus Uhrbacteria bacterium]|nr:DsbA family protein [Candidatus Uhrbacteria bacterium]